ncbi:hypothetical protein GPZ80_00005, partial [Actinokineospora sp. HBU206404]|nr:hypothetical protein [Actinokineospora xionganensis]
STQPTTEPTTTQPTSSTQPTTKPTTTAPTSSTQPTTTATTSSTQPTTQPPTTEPTTTEPTTTTVTTLPVVNTQIPSGGVGGYVPTSNNSNGELANTGVSLAWPLGIGLLLIALGANALLVMRLRARRR